MRSNRAFNFAGPLSYHAAARAVAGLLLLLIALTTPVLAAAPPATLPDQPAKVHELIDLLNDPQVQAWIKEQAASPSTGSAAPAETHAQLGGQVAARLGAIREHLTALLAAIPSLPTELARAAETLDRESQGHSRTAILLYLAVFVFLGAGTERVFLRATARLRLSILGLSIGSTAQRLGALAAWLGYRVVTVGVFGLASLGAFLIFDWPPLLREILFEYLVAFVALRLAMVTSGFLLAPASAAAADLDRLRVLPVTESAARFWHRHLALLAGWFAFGYATVVLLDELGFGLGARHLVAYVLGLGLLAIGLDLVWRRPTAESTTLLRRRMLSWLASTYFVVIWLLWVASAIPTMWFLAVVAVVPWAIRGAQRAVTHLLRPPGGTETATVPSVLEVALKRGLRASFIIAGALFLIKAWQIDLTGLAFGDTVFTQLVRGLFSSVVIIMVADFGWELIKTAIDRKIKATPTSDDPHSETWRRQARLKTLLPIFRNLLLIVLLVIVALMVLASLGVNIGPLIAGASVVGVAIGFGAQTLVRDIISGMFYLLDDAFRVGEYIQSGNFKGTVESFSLRSVKLRHHRGPIFTVPFSVLGAVQNMSRDWVIDKLSIGVTYDTDLGKVKKIIKEIGKQLLEDPELKPKIIETLKMQGVEQFGDYAIQIRMKMMTKPNEQFVIRRRAYAMIKQAFEANGVKFAFPTVQVAGGEASPTEVASVAQLALPKAVAKG